MSYRPPDLRHLPLPIVLEDARFVVVAKPSGLLSVAAKDLSITDNVVSRISARYPESSGPLSVHRLDMDTSGLMVVALDADAHRDLSIQFQERRIEKTYVAVVDGEVEADRGEIDLPLRLDPERRPLQVVDHRYGRPAQTAWTVLRREDGHTRIELRPKTGRTHQLRVHCAHAQGLARPILGDRLYGSANSSSRLMLHARRLAFEHPGDFSRVEVENIEPF